MVLYALLGHIYTVVVNNWWLVVALFLVNLSATGLWVWRVVWSAVGENPFARDSARPPEPLVTDRKARDAVLKQSFIHKNIPQQVDAIVIGSGIGGLTVANILARAGKRVLVLEQHDQAGGCCHTFEDKGFEFDIGIHYIGEMQNNAISYQLINQMTNGQLVWKDLDDVFDECCFGKPDEANHYCMHRGKDARRAAMLKAFPDEETAINAFFTLIKDVNDGVFGAVLFKVVPKPITSLLIQLGLSGWITSFFKHGSKSLKQTLDELTDNTRLKAVMSYNYADYGVPPADASFALHAMLTNHFMDGGSFPRGGASEIAFHMIPPIEAAGGRVLVRAPITRILVNDKGRVNGVRVKHGDTAFDLHSPLVISDAGAPNTLFSLLPPEIASKSSIYQLLKEKTVESGVGAMSLFVGLKGTSKELGLKAQNVWVFPDDDLDLVKRYINLPVEEALCTEVPILFVGFPSAKDPTYSERYPGKSTCTVVTFANWKWFEEWGSGQVNKRGPDYERVKQNIGDRMWQQVVAHYPSLKDKVEFMEVGTPASNRHYINAPRGEIYGLDHNLIRFADPKVFSTLRADTDIPGLLLTGQDVFSGGFMGAVMGAVFCATKVLNRNVYQDLVNLKKSIDKIK